MGGGGVFIYIYVLHCRRNRVQASGGFSSYRIFSSFSRDQSLQQLFYSGTQKTVEKLDDIEAISCVFEISFS